MATLLAAITGLREATELSQRTAQAAAQDAADVKHALVELLSSRSPLFAQRSPLLTSSSRQQQQQISVATGATSSSSSSSLSSSSSSSAGKATAGRLAMMEGTVLSENSGLLRMAREQSENIRKLHDPSVPSEPPPLSFASPPASFPSSSFVDPYPKPASTSGARGGGSGFGGGSGGGVAEAGMWGAGGGNTREINRPPSKHTLLDFLGDDMRHRRPVDPSVTGLELLSTFFAQQAKGALYQKKIKSLSEWMSSMVKAQKEAAVSGKFGIALQITKHIEVMVDINNRYGWPACEKYWYDLQTEVDRERHSMENDDPWNARCWAAMIEKFPLLTASAGRPAKAATTAATSSSSSSASASSRDKNKKKKGQKYCEKHSWNATHDTAGCNHLNGTRPNAGGSAVPGNPTPSASSGGGGGRQ
jgi:hypothetical protein